MPNIKGMALNDVLFLLENYGLKIDYSGRGSVKKVNQLKRVNLLEKDNL